MIDANGVSRGTKCLGAYPSGYLAFLKENGWWGEKRILEASKQQKLGAFQ